MYSAHSAELMDALDALPGTPLHERVWRVVWKSRDVLATGGGGRWNHPGRPDVLYCSLDANGAIAEVYHHLSRAPVFSTAEKLLYALDVRTRRTLVIDSEHLLAKLGVDSSDLLVGDVHTTRNITHAAFLLDFDSMLVPSVRWNCMNLILFDECLNEGRVKVGDFNAINWPAWRETYAKQFSRIKREGVDILKSPDERQNARHKADGIESGESDGGRAQLLVGY